MKSPTRYREKIDWETVVAETEDVDKTDFVEPDKVKNILSDIEQRVNDILNDLVKIKGLTEIDEVREKVKSLSDDLY